MTRLEGSLLVASPVASGNALGRALSLADLAASVVSRVSLVAPDDGPLWPAASRWHHPVHRLAKGSTLPQELDAMEFDWVWVVKPLQKSWLIAEAVTSVSPDAALILDLDDDDGALSSEFAEASFLNRLRLHPFRQLNPSRIAQTRKTALARADGITVASRAVAERLVPDREAVRIPHPRGISTAPRRRVRPDDGTKHIGFFGTARGHKGIESLVSMLENDPAVRLHVFAGSQPSAVDDPARIIEHPVDESYERLFAAVDAVVIPQRETPGGDVQLPAKLLDAMSSGAPVITSPTKAIKEIAGDTALYVTDWSDPDEVTAALDRCLDEGERLGERSRERFERAYSLEASVQAFRELLVKCQAN